MNKHQENKYSIKVYCQGQYKNFPQKLLLHHDGSVGNIIRYQDICTDKYVANIAFQASYIAVNNTFVENVAGPTGHGDFVGKWSSIPFMDEITLPFLEKFNIIATLIDCNYSMPLLDEDTGEWGGVVGQVNICFEIILGLQIGKSSIFCSETGLERKPYFYSCQAHLQFKDIQYFVD